MKRISLQSGSSTFGLIAATGLFVGLMVYTTQFAFVKQENNADKQAVSTESAPAAMLASLIAPVMGIFYSETIQSEEADKAMQSDSVNKTPPETVQAELPLSNSTHSANNAKVASEDSVPASGVTAQKELPVETMIAAPFIPENFDRNRINLLNQHQANQHQVNTHMVNQNQQYATGQYYGNTRRSGKGKGAGNGQGEFGFSMSLKSRANMNANTDWDGGYNGQSSAYGYNAANYQQNAYANHSNQYQYRQY